MYDKQTFEICSKILVKELNEFVLKEIPEFATKKDFTDEEKYEYTASIMCFFQRHGSQTPDEVGNDPVKHGLMEMASMHVGQIMAGQGLLTMEEVKSEKFLNILIKVND